MDTFPPVVTCEFSGKSPLRAALNVPSGYSIDPVSGLRDRTEIYNIPSALPGVLVPSHP